MEPTAATSVADPLPTRRRALLAALGGAAALLAGPSAEAAAPRPRRRRFGRAHVEGLRRLERMR